MGISSISAENGEMSENVYLSTAPRREANSRGCRGTKIKEKCVKTVPKVEGCKRIDFRRHFGAFWGHFWLLFGPKKHTKIRPKTRTENGGVLGGPKWIRVRSAVFGPGSGGARGGTPLKAGQNPRLATWSPWAVRRGIVLVTFS